ncbi:MAG: hypothetical protein OSA97_16255 [Nevskia sp.]|nr:hypothetical protein [Nevskia sp.]
MKIIAVPFLCMATGFVGFLFGQRQERTALHYENVIGLVADIGAMSHVINLLKAGQVDKALQWQKDYLAVVRTGLINVQRSGMSSPAIEQAIADSGKAIEPDSPLNR